MTNLRAISRIIESAHPGQKFNYVFTRKFAGVTGDIVLAIPESYMALVRENWVLAHEASEYAVMSLGKGDFGALKQHANLFHEMLDINFP